MTFFFTSMKPCQIMATMIIVGIIHGQVIRKDQIQKIADLNVLASEYAVHTFYWGRLASKLRAGLTAGRVHLPQL